MEVLRGICLNESNRVTGFICCFNVHACRIKRVLPIKTWFVKETASIRSLYKSEDVTVYIIQRPKLIKITKTIAAPLEVKSESPWWLKPSPVSILKTSVKTIYLHVLHHYTKS